MRRQTDEGSSIRIFAESRYSTVQITRMEAVHTAEQAERVTKGLPMARKASGQWQRWPPAERCAPGASLLQPVLPPDPLVRPSQQWRGHCWPAVWPQPAASSAPARWPGLPVESHQRRRQSHTPAPVRAEQ